LFPAPVHDGLDEIWRRAQELRSLKKQMASAFATEGHYGEGNPEREHDLIRWMYDRFTALPDLFGAEMRLA
jgi:hypothetical protein